ncbi:carbohydrate ABC transporter permease [Massilia sp. W12]|uniref:carbohydrate ABC transporter permease n=1 Tax=Massilia sp. W12 TaxID=3126507 RepID=UPI0030CAB01A
MSSPWPLRALQYLLLFLMAALCLYPFWWTLCQALAQDSAPLWPPPLVPANPGLGNFVEVANNLPIARHLGNSILITAATVGLRLLFCTLAAWALARWRFRGKRLALGILFATLLLPSEVNFLVNFITISKLGWHDSLAGVLAPNLVHVVSIFMLQQAFAALPADLMDAARLDGAGEFQVFFHIALPLLAPWLATVAILGAVEAWNDYLWPSIVLSRPEDLPLSAAVLYLKGVFGSNAQVIAAGAIITVLPVTLLFLACQRFFLRGLDGALK